MKLRLTTVVSIHIPLLSAWLKKVGFGDMTVFKLASTLLAFLSVVFFRLSTGKKLAVPPQSGAQFATILMHGQTPHGQTTHGQTTIAGDHGTTAQIEASISLSVTFIKQFVNSYLILKAILVQNSDAEAIAAAKKAVGTCGLSYTSIFFTSLSFMSALASLPADPTVPGYEWRRASAALSVVSALVSQTYNLTNEGTTPEQMAIENFFLTIAVLQFLVYDGAYVAEMEGAMDAGPQKDSELYLASGAMVENVAQSVASAGRYVGMMAALLVNTSVGVDPALAEFEELGEIPAIAGFMADMIGGEALNISKALGVKAAYDAPEATVHTVAASS